MDDNKSLKDTLDNLVGDIPVSEQLGVALDRMSEKEHKHDEYATHDEINEINKKIELLMDLVGDTSVSEQINVAINQTKK